MISLVKLSIFVLLLFASDAQAESATKPERYKIIDKEGMLREKGILVNQHEIGYG